MDEKKYYGGILVKSSSVLPDFRMKNGNEYYKLVLEDGRIEVVPKNIYDVCVTDTPKDASDLMNERMNILVAEIVDILKEYNIKISEIAYMAQKLEGTIDMVVDKSDSILWGKSVNDKTFQDIDFILKNKKVTLDEIKK